MKLVFPSKITILSVEITVKYDKNSDGGWFSLKNSEIGIGVQSIKKDSKYVFSVISHEIMEAILCLMGARFESTRTSTNYLFSFDHQTFENAIQIHADAIRNFIK